MVARTVGVTVNAITRALQTGSSASVTRGVAGATVDRALSYGITGTQGDQNNGTGPVHLDLVTGTTLFGSTRQWFGAGNPFVIMSLHNGVGAGGLLGIASCAQWNNVALASEPSVLMYRSRGTSIGANGAVASGDVLGLFQWCADDGVTVSSAGYTVAANLEVWADGTVSTGIVPSRWIMKVADVAGALQLGIDLRSDLSVAVLGTIRSSGGTARFDTGFNSENVAVTGASGDGVTATLTYSSSYNLFAVGHRIIVSGMNPAGYNTTGAAVTASSVGSVSYANATSSAFVSGGIIGDNTASIVIIENGFSPQVTNFQTLGDFQYKGYSSNGTATVAGFIRGIMAVPTAGAVSGQIAFTVMAAGSNATYLTIDGNTTAVAFTGISTQTQHHRTTAPNTQTGATYTIAATDNYVILNRAGTVTITFQAASGQTGRRLKLQTYTANTVVSGASNVVPLGGGSAGTAILAATAGKWAELVSDGSNWVIVAAA